jgi:dihydroxyacetone kinase-like protein
MTNAVGYYEMVQMIRGAIEQVKSEHKLLSELDSATGDGDHGTTMLRAMKNIEKLTDESDKHDLKNLLHSVGWTFLGVDGGATGPLLGTFFIGMSDSLGENQILDCKAFAGALEAGLAALQKQTKAQKGDKTMIDALFPAVEAFRDAADQNKGVSDALHRAAEAAEQGAFSTKDMKARFGRAKNLGDRTIGHPDPGAKSISLIFLGFYLGIQNLQA